jgi:hypothetical protein
MDSRFARAVVSFALVAAAYWAYLNIAEPLMARPLSDHPNASGNDVALGAAAGGNGQAQHPATNQSPAPTKPLPTERFISLIEPHFPVGAWERAADYVIKNDQFMLLCKEFKTTDDGRLHFFPCTIVFQRHGLARDPVVRSGDHDQRTWIVQAPEGAVLSFDEPMDQRMMNVGRLQAAFVQGQVTIRGSESKPGAADQIELTTQNVQLSEKQIWTPGEVHFRVGPHFGSGRDLTIAMSPVARGDIKRLPTTIPARVQSIELVHLDKLQVSMPRQRQVPVGNGRFVQQTDHVPVSIHSEGYLLMEMARGVAQITKKVHISRPRLDATRLEDHLECELLSLYFSRNLIFADDGRDRPPPFEFERLVATGEPAIAYSSPQGSGVAQANYLLESPKFELEMNGRPEFLAEGAGRVRGLIDQAGRQAEVSWQGGLRYKELERGALLSVEQQAVCNVDAMGQVTAERVEVQLARSGPAGGMAISGLQPTRIVADGRVRANVRQVKAQVNSLTVSFRQQALVGTEGGLRLNAAQPVTGPKADRSFIVTGDSMQLGVVRDGDKIAIDEISVDRQVRCLEVAGNNAGHGAEITGEHFDLKQIASGAAVGQFSGAPVAIRANRLDVRGTTVRFEQANNRLWIEGAGSAALPLPPRVAQQFAGRATVGYLNWQRSLSFDGDEVRVDGGVELRGPAQVIRCATLQGKLSQPIRMADASAGARLEMDGLELTNITADGGVLFENRTFDQRGLIAVDTGTMQRMNIDQRSAEFLGVGPGQIKTIRFVDNALAGQQVLGKPGPGVAAGNRQLGYLRVQFQRQVAGNLQVRRLAFDSNVQAIYGPVPNWDTELPDDPRRLADGQVSLRCDRMSVAQILRRGQKQAPFEFESQGNTILEGREFQARADRLSYDQGKDLVILRGGDRDDAQIIRSSGGKQQSTSARVIKYWPKGNRINVEGANEIQLN